MLKNLGLKNFKAFGSQAEIPLAPITLIYGQNSAGKSSITQSLLLLKQTLDNREAGTALLPRIENGLVDLGSFQELIFDHDFSNKLSIRVESAGDRKNPLSNKPHEFSLEFEFSRQSIKSETVLSAIHLYASEYREIIASFAPAKTTRPTPVVFESSGYGGVSLASSIKAQCFYLTKDKRFWKDSYNYVKGNSKRIINKLEQLNKDVVGRGPSVRGLFLLGRPPEATSSDRYWTNLISECHSLVRKNFSIEEWIEFIQPHLVRGTIAVNSFMPVGRDISMQAFEYLFNPEIDTNNIFVSSSSVLPDPTKIAIDTARHLSDAIDKVFPLGPFRRAPERYYIYTGSSPSDVGYAGNLTPDLLFRNPALLKKANAWLKRLEVGYQLKIKTLGQGKDLFELRLVDTVREGATDTSMSDVGFGISQLLPFVVQSLAAGGQIITIEQPEVHIHPKLQADLGSLIHEASQAPLQNQFIIETHSEHLMLRFQKLIRDKKMSPNRICVLFVSRGKNGSTVKHIRVDDEGNFIDRWPGGFFAERIREL